MQNCVPRDKHGKAWTKTTLTLAIKANSVQKRT